MTGTIRNEIAILAALASIACGFFIGRSHPAHRYVPLSTQGAFVLDEATGHVCSPFNASPRVEACPGAAEAQKEAANKAADARMAAAIEAYAKTINQYEATEADARMTAAADAYDKVLAQSGDKTAAEDAFENALTAREVSPQRVPER